jgi:cytochrome c-type biogenesis protein CcmE
VKQTTIQRLFDIGDIEFSAVDSNDAMVVFYGVASPNSFRTILQAQS